jgi:hypothetical protein
MVEGGRPPVRNPRWTAAEGAKAPHSTQSATTSLGCREFAAGSQVAALAFLDRSGADEPAS